AFGLLWQSCNRDQQHGQHQHTEICHRDCHDRLLLGCLRTPIPTISLCIYMCNATRGEASRGKAMQCSPYPRDYRIRICNHRAWFLFGCACLSL
ncbi:hypothetical protein T265_12117, partial [Opisthorchis viverrini]